MKRDEQIARANERAKIMYAYYLTGKTLEQVGERYGMSKQRVKQIFLSKGYESSRGRSSYGTPEQRFQKIIDFIRIYRENNAGSSPVLSEIAQEVYGNPSYKGSISNQVRCLIDEGYLKYSPNGRMLLLTEKAYAMKYVRSGK